MANSLLHRIGSLLLRHSPAPNLDQIHRLHRQAAGTLTSSGCKRFFSGGHDHDDIEETHKWRKITAAAYVASIGMIFYTFAGDEHEHDEHAGHAERPAYSYLHIRKKEFPWGKFDPLSPPILCYLLIHVKGFSMSPDSSNLFQLYKLS
ncbi:unnamed protein product [Sphagnum jensenii]